jgi:hypothetical protein
LARAQSHTHTQAKEVEEEAKMSRHKELADKLLTLESATHLLEEAVVLWYFFRQVRDREGREG